MADKTEASDPQPALEPSEPVTLLAGKGAPITVDVEKAAEAFRFFEEFKRRLLKPEDSVEIQSRKHIKKSGWSKYRLACNVSDEVIIHRRVPPEGKDAQGQFYHEFWVRAFHRPTGRSSVGVAIASNSERKGWSHEEHDIFTLAHTRAKNRATSDLVGGGEVSAEEILPGEHSEHGATQQTSPNQASSEWHVPVKKQFADLPSVSEYPLQHGERTVGQINVDSEHGELGFVPEARMKTDTAPFQKFLLPRILQPIIEQHPDTKYFLSVGKDRILEAVLVKTSAGPDRLGKLMTELHDPVAWSFSKAAEAKQ